MKSSYEKEKGQFRIERHDINYAGFTLKAVGRNGRHYGWALPGGGFIKVKDTNRAKMIAKRIGLMMPEERTIHGMVRNFENRIKSL